MPDGMTYRQLLARGRVTIAAIEARPVNPGVIEREQQGQSARAAEAFATAAKIAAASGDPMMAAYLRDLAMNRRLAAKQRSA